MNYFEELCYCVRVYSCNQSLPLVLLAVVKANKKAKERNNAISFRPAITFAERLVKFQRSLLSFSQLVDLFAVNVCLVLCRKFVQSSSLLCKTDELRHGLLGCDLKHSIS